MTILREKVASIKKAIVVCCDFIVSDAVLYLYFIKAKYTEY